MQLACAIQIVPSPPRACAFCCRVATTRSRCWGDEGAVKKLFDAISDACDGVNDNCGAREGGRSCVRVCVCVFGGEGGGGGVGYTGWRKPTARGPGASWFRGFDPTSPSDGALSIPRVLFVVSSNSGLSRWRCYLGHRLRSGVATDERPSLLDSATKRDFYAVTSVATTGIRKVSGNRYRYVGMELRI